MQKKGRFALSRVLLFSLPLVYGSTVYAANPVDLSHLNASYLRSFISAGPVQLKEVRHDMDFNKTLHVRLQEMYQGYPVLGGEAIVHVPNGKNSSLTAVSASNSNQDTLDGTLYQGLEADLANAPAYVFTAAQAQKILKQAIDTYQHRAGGNINAQDQESKLLVFIDNGNKAHWAYQVSFYVAPAKDGVMPTKPVYIMDAVTGQVYAQYDAIKTMNRREASDDVGGGFGGNLKMGKMVYDGLADNLPSLKIQRDASTQTCLMKNSDVTVKGYKGGKIESYTCAATEPEHNNVYWWGDKDAVNGGYSPADDAMFGGMVIKNMYKEWYGVPVLTNPDGSPMMLNMVVHDPIDNAYWDGRQMTFGDGVTMFYPLTSLGVAAHEISHGFTEQHSNLSYYGQSGGMNEAFSDMAAQGAEFYAYGKNSWQIGPEIFKKEGEALRYMDKPSKDCHGKKPGSWCSIDTADQYYEGLDVHFSSGVYNHFFYILGNLKGWDVKKAFDVMVHANANYWTSNTNFKTGACGVLKATKDFRFRLKDIKDAFTEVGIDASKC